LFFTTIFRGFPQVAPTYRRDTEALLAQRATKALPTRRMAASLLRGGCLVLLILGACGQQFYMDLPKIQEMRATCARGPKDFIRCNASNICRRMYGTSPIDIADQSMCKCLDLCQWAITSGSYGVCYAQWNAPTATYYFSIQTNDGSVTCDPQPGKSGN